MCTLPAGPHTPAAYAILQVITDTMATMHLMVLASRMPGGKAEWADMALQHARTVAQNHFRQAGLVWWSQLAGWIAACPPACAAPALNNITKCPPPPSRPCHTQARRLHLPPAQVRPTHWQAAVAGHPPGLR